MTEQEASISCIIPVYNGARFIGEALESVLDQSLPVDEVIVVDDGSSDSLDEALGSFRNRIRVVRQENQGPAAARNRGVRESTGSYLCFLDSDDVWHREKLERQMQRFRDKPSLQLSLTFQRPFWVPELADERDRLVEHDHPFSKDHAGYVCQAMLMPKATFLTVGGFNEQLRIGEDTDWLSRAREKGIEIEILEEVLLYRRIHESNLSYSAYANRGELRLNFVIEQLKRRRAAVLPPGSER
jgi:glycosyltransferase involved in cell wall biosynthesis